MYLYLCNCILFCIFSSFYWGRAKFNKFDCILALYVFICLYKFGIIQYILNINVFAFVFFHTILTVAQNTQIAYLTIIPECYIVYLVMFPICASPGGVLYTLRGNTWIVHLIEVYPYKSLVFGLNVQSMAVAVHACINCASTNCLHFCIYVLALNSTLACYLQGFSHWWHHRNTLWWDDLGTILRGLTHYYYFIYI